MYCGVFVFVCGALCCVVFCLLLFGGVLFVVACRCVLVFVWSCVLVRCVLFVACPCPLCVGSCLLRDDCCLVGFGVLLVRCWSLRDECLLFGAWWLLVAACCVLLHVIDGVQFAVGVVGCLRIASCLHAVDGCVLIVVAYCLLGAWCWLRVVLMFVVYCASFYV